MINKDLCEVELGLSVAGHASLGFGLWVWALGPRGSGPSVWESKAQGP